MRPAPPRNAVRATLGDAAAGALLLLGLGLTVVLFALLPAPAANLTVAGCALAAVLGLWQPNRFLVLVAIAAVAGIVAALIATQARNVSLTDLLLAPIAVILMGVAGIAVSARIRRPYRRVAEYQRTNEALTPIDANTGALKPSFGRDQLRSEIARSLRYGRSFSLLVGRPADYRGDMERRGPEEAAASFNDAVRLIVRRLRTTDIIALEPERAVAIILTETAAESGEHAAQHLQRTLRSEGQIEMRFGLVQCPDDGITEERLTSEAYEALAFAETANIPLASRRELLAGTGMR